MSKFSKVGLKGIIERYISEVIEDKMQHYFVELRQEWEFILENGIGEYLFKELKRQASLINEYELDLYFNEGDHSSIGTALFAFMKDLKNHNHHDIFKEVE